MDTNKTNTDLEYKISLCYELLSERPELYQATIQVIELLQQALVTNIINQRAGNGHD